MSPPDLRNRRHVLSLLCWGPVLGVTGPGVVRPAWANDGEGNSGPRGDGDRGGDDRDEDRDGRGRGRGRGGDDDQEGRDHEASGYEEVPDGRSESGRSHDLSRGRVSVRDDRRDLRDITVRYPDGWMERIVGGRYELIDHQSRLVVRRAATAGDFARMIALR